MKDGHGLLQLFYAIVISIMKLRQLVLLLTVEKSSTLDSRYSPSDSSYCNDAKISTTTTMVTTTTFSIFAQTGTFRLSYKNLRRKLARVRVPSGTRLQSSLRSEASHPRGLEIITVAVKFMEADWPLK